VRKKASLNIKPAYLFVFLCNLVSAQTRNFQLSHASAIVYRQQVICFGIANRDRGSELKIYSVDSTLSATDSLVLKRDSPVNEYLEMYSDSLHGFLNIYLQKKNSKAVSIVRVDEKLRRTALLENVDVARLNNRSMFSQPFYQGEFVYDVITEKDSSGMQFYLNRYKLKSPLENFDYLLQWQFPFERKNITSARVIKADEKYVFIFVMVKGGNNTGEWILKLKSANGQLVKGTRLNKNEKIIFLYGSSNRDKTQNLLVVGQKIAAEKYYGAATTLKNEPVQLYVIQADSTGEKTLDAAFTIPVNEQVRYGDKKIYVYVLRMADAEVTSDGAKIETDIMKGAGGCYQYCNTIQLRLKKNDDGIHPEKQAISSNPLIGEYLNSKEQLDMNGKLCVEGDETLRKIVWEPIPLPVKKFCKWDASNNIFCMVSKTSIRRSNINFSLIAPVSNKYKTISILETAKISNPVLMALSKTLCVQGRQTSDDAYELKLINW
jgi:hypothetical protein